MGAIIKILKLTKVFENLFEDELNCMDDSIRNALFSYIPPKDIVNLSFEKIYEDKLMFLGIHVVPIILCDNEDEFVKSCGERKRRRKRKVMNKLEWMRAKIKKKIYFFNFSTKEDTLE